MICPLTDSVSALDICVWRVEPERSQNVYLQNSRKFKSLALRASKEPRNICTPPDAKVSENTFCTESVKPSDIIGICVCRSAAGQLLRVPAGRGAAPGASIRGRRGVGGGLQPGRWLRRRARARPLLRQPARRPRRYKFSSIIKCHTSDLVIDLRSVLREAR
jgi:hypothetical protein